MEQLGFLNDFLDKLKSKTSTVALNISSKSVLEIIEFDSQGMIINYASVPIQYNSFTKELENVNDFVSAIKRTFSELNLNIKSKAYVSIPTFVIENATFPKIDDDEQIQTLLTSSVETNYIFKKYDPQIAYKVIPDNNNDSMSITYTALRQDEFGKIIGVLQEIGLNIVAVDSSQSSLINGVITTQKVNPKILDNNEQWNVINITSNSFVIYGMKGRQLVSIYEEPLAVKSFTEEEVYQVITNSLDLVLDKYPANQTVFVSQSDEVSAEYLASVVNIDSTKSYIEDNKYRKQLIELGYNITQSNKTKISLEAIGIASWPFNKDGFKFNFITGGNANVDSSVLIESITIPLGNKEVELTPELIKKFAIIYCVIVFLVSAISFGLVKIVGNILEKEQTEITAQIAALEKETNSQPKQTGITEAEFLQKAYTNNMNFKKSYSSIAQEIPIMLWIEEIQLNNESQLYMAGRSYKMDDILNYYDSLNKLGKFSNLKISVLRISNTPISDLLLNSNSDMTEETTYEFAFGQSFYIDPNAQITIPENDANTQKQDSSVPLPPGASNKKEDAAPLPPPPTNIPKQDK